MIREFVWENVDLKIVERLDRYLLSLGEIVLNNRYTSITQDRPDFNAVTVRGSGYTVAAFFPSVRRGDYSNGGAPSVVVGIGADDSRILDEVESRLRQIFEPSVEVVAPRKKR